MERGKALMLILGLILFSIGVPPVMAQKGKAGPTPIPNPYINVTETNATIVVENEYNEIIINKTSHSIKAIVFNKGSFLGENVNPSKLPAFDILYVVNNTRMRVTWTSHDVLKISNDRVRINLVGEINNNTISVIIMASAYKPYIDFIVNLPEQPGFYYLLIPVNKSLDKEWILSMSYYTTKGLETLTTENLTLNPTGLGLDALAILGVSTHNKTRQLDLVLGFSNLPGYTTPLEAGALPPENVTVQPYNTINNTFYLMAAYGGASRTVGLRLVLNQYDPYAVLAGGLEDPVLAAYPKASRDYKGVIYESDILDSLNRTISLMKDRLKNLTEINEKLEKNVSTCKGCKSYWSNELHVKDLTIKRLNERLKRGGLLALGVFFLGLILGVGGGYYVIGVQKKKVGVRRRR